MRFARNHFWGILVGVIAAEMYRKKGGKPGMGGGGY